MILGDLLPVLVGCLWFLEANLQRDRELLASQSARDVHESQDENCRLFARVFAQVQMKPSCPMRSEICSGI